MQTQITFRNAGFRWLSIHTPEADNPDSYAGCIHPAFVDGRKHPRLFQLQVFYNAHDGRLVSHTEICTSITRAQLAAKAIIDEEAMFHIEDLIA